MATLLAWVTFPGGGVYPWVWIPAAAAALLLAVSVRSLTGTRPALVAVDVGLAVTGLAIAVQLLPLSPAMLRAINPHAIRVRAALWMTPSDALRQSWPVPITIVPGDTLAALGIFAAAAMLFWTTRAVCAAGGSGRIIRAIAFIGLVASIAAIVQRASSPQLLYGIWRPLDAGARPYGPFVNRNHFATWIVMACPLVFGYLLARATPTTSSRRLSQRAAEGLKELGSIRTWLMASVSIMTLALLISTSRSGLVGFACAAGVTALLARRAIGRSTRRWIGAQAAVLVLVAIAFANFGSLSDRLAETLRSSSAGRGRAAVWNDARRMIRDFPLTGTGAGTFGTTITVYQTAEPGYSIGHAHNHYLQLAAEGGALIAVPTAVVFGSFGALFFRRLELEAGPDYLVRVGAMAGISGALIQSIWETGLRMPGNAMLLAVVAAIAVQPVNRQD